MWQKLSGGSHLALIIMLSWTTCSSITNKRPSLEYYMNAVDTNHDRTAFKAVNQPGVVLVALLLAQLPCVSMNHNNDLLRSRYLGFWLTVSQHKPQANITFPHSTESLKGQLIAIDSQSNRIRVDNLNTPTGNLPHTALRITDIDTIDFPILS